MNMRNTSLICAVLFLAALSFAQSPPSGDTSTGAEQTSKHTKKQKKQKGAAAEVGSGVGTTATGVAKGAGHTAEGVGKGAADLATLHPVDAGAAVGKGAAKGGEDVAAGSAKGVGKISKGVGHALKKIF
jgi:hypothetical protein